MEGFLLNSEFKNIVKLVENQRVSGQSNEQAIFRDLLLNVTDGNVTSEDWKLLLSRSPSNFLIRNNFSNAIKLSYRNEKVTKDNFKALTKLGNPVAKIKALHNNKKASKLSSDEMAKLYTLLLELK